MQSLHRMAVDQGGADDEDSPIATRSQLEPTMSKSTTHRLTAFALSALLTLCTLGGIDRLATQPQEAGAQWAQQLPSTRA